MGLLPDVNEIDTNNVDTDGPGASITASAGTNWIDPLYDEAGNMYSGPKPGDEGTAASRQFYVYDAWNRMVEVWEDTNGDGDKDAEGTDSQVLACAYDGLHRRIEKVDTTGENDVTYDSYYNTAWQVLEIRKASSRTQEFEGHRSSGDKFGGHNMEFKRRSPCSQSSEMAAISLRATPCGFPTFRGSAGMIVAAPPPARRRA